MSTTTNTAISANGIKQGLSEIKHHTELDGQVIKSEDDPMAGISDDEKIDFVAAKILREHKAAFLELAK